MPKINVYLPDDLAEAVREAGIPVSAVCQRALEQAVRRVTAIRETALGTADVESLTARLTNFTARTRTVIGLAVEQARAEGVAQVGSHHLLGGILAEGTNLALHVLRAVEVDPDRLREELRQHAVDTPGLAMDTAAGDGALRFASDAANALELAVTEATALGHNYVGCEHLLLGLIAEPDGRAGHVLRAMGAEQRLTRRAVVAALAGYVHLRADQAAGQEPAAAGQSPPAQVQALLAEAVRQELRPIVRRLERLEARAGITAEE